MPSITHETLLELFRHRPELAAELLADPFGLSLPAYREARLESAEFSDITPTQYRADAVVVLSRDRPVLAVVVETQLSRDRRKRWSWPVYLSTLRARLRCPAILLVLCTSERVAQWCAQPIDLGHPGLVLMPVVLGPDRVPLVTDPTEAGRAPELAVLSALAHGAEPGGLKVLDALSDGLATIDEDRSSLYSDFVITALPEAARRYLEGLLAVHLREYKSEFVRGYIFQGRVEAQLAALLAVLDVRGIAISDAARERIEHCTDQDQLDAWIRRAAVADSIDEIFDGDEPSSAA